MLVVMQQGATEAQIQKIIDHLTTDGFDVHRSTGVIHTVLGGVGGKEDFDTALVEAMDGVKEVHRIVSPYKLASRAFRPQGTVVKIGDVEIGGSAVIVMAGRAAWRIATRSSARPISWPMAARASFAAARSSPARRPTAFRASAKRDWN